MKTKFNLRDYVTFNALKITQDLCLSEASTSSIEEYFIYFVPFSVLLLLRIYWNRNARIFQNVQCVFNERKILNFMTWKMLNTCLNNKTSNRIANFVFLREYVFKFREYHIFLTEKFRKFSNNFSFHIPCFFCVLIGYALNRFQCRKNNWTVIKTKKTYLSCKSLIFSGWFIDSFVCIKHTILLSFLYLTLW